MDQCNLLSLFFNYYYYEDDDYDDAIFLGLIETGFIPFWVGVCLI